MWESLDIDKCIARYIPVTPFDANFMRVHVSPSFLNV